MKGLFDLIVSRKRLNTSETILQQLPPKAIKSHHPLALVYWWRWPWNMNDESPALLQTNEEEPTTPCTNHASLLSQTHLIPTWNQLSRPVNNHPKPLLRYTTLLPEIKLHQEKKKAQKNKRKKNK